MILTTWMTDETPSDEFLNITDDVRFVLAALVC
jgi:hypothetical protein